MRFFLSIRNIKINYPLLNYGNQGGRRLILSEKYQSKIYSGKIWKSRRAATDFVGGISNFNSTLLNYGNQGGRRLILSEENHP